MTTLPRAITQAQATLQGRGEGHHRHTLPTMTPCPVAKYPPDLTTAERGYGGDHQRRRRRVKRVVDAGGGVCARCGRPILLGQAWDLGHDDLDRSLYSGPEHRFARDCPAGGNRATNARGRATARRWVRRRRFSW
jgi:hypothetical protein